MVDASQTAGVFPIDLRAQHISVLCFTGHKSLMGPQGTGGLCVAEGVDIRPWCVGGTACRRSCRHSRRSIPHGSKPERATATASRGWLAAVAFYSGGRAWMPSGTAASLRWPAGFTRA